MELKESRWMPYDHYILNKIWMEEMEKLWFAQVFWGVRISEKDHEEARKRIEQKCDEYQQSKNLKKVNENY